MYTKLERERERERLEALDNETLFGAEEWQRLREEQVEEQLESQRFKLLWELSAEELFGDWLEELRADKITEIMGGQEEEVQ